MITQLSLHPNPLFDEPQAHILGGNVASLTLGGHGSASLLGACDRPMIGYLRDLAAQANHLADLIEGRIAP